MKVNSEPLVCEHCGKEHEYLVTRHGMFIKHLLEWVCEDCFRELEGVSFEKYSEKDYESCMCLDI